MKNIKLNFLILFIFCCPHVYAQVTQTNVFITPGNECGTFQGECERSSGIVCFDISIETDFTDVLSSYTFFIAESNCNIETVMPDNISCIMSDQSLPPLNCVPTIGEVFRSVGNTGTISIVANTQIKIHTFCVQLDAGQTNLDFSGFQLTTDFVNTPGDPTPVLTGVTNYNINDICGPLPVELSKFSARLINQNEAIVEWETETELNNDYFMVQRRSNSTNEFKDVFKVNGAGTSFSTKTYSFIDDLPRNGTEFYYRLKQVDFDEKTEFSHIELVQRELSEKEELLTLFPNPNDGNFSLQFSVNSPNTTISISIEDPFGRNVLTEVINEVYDVGVFEKKIALDNLSSGMYFVKILENKNPKPNLTFIVY